MKLIIDIPEKTVNEIKDNAMFAGTIPSEILWDVTSAIVNGTPLPKGHGRLIDADALKKKMQGTDRYFQIKYDIEEAPTVAIPQTDCNTCDKAVRNRVGVIGCAKFDSKPTVDIPSAERGNWKYIGNKDISQSIKIVECDKCHKRSYGSTKFCPNCGIKMDCTTLD